MAMSYMGTKRALVPAFRQQILDVAGAGPVLDLFSGMGSVVESLASERPIIANDFLSFTGAFAKARFLPRRMTDPLKVSRDLVADYLSHRDLLTTVYARRLAAEGRALAGGASTLAEYLDEVPHAGNSYHYKRAATDRKAPDHDLHYSMTCLYFSGAYFSTRQAVDLDALRYAIDNSSASGNSREWLLASWLNAAGMLSNSPGHTAQFLRPNTDAAFARIARTWERSVWETFCDSLRMLRPAGTASWRRTNRVTTQDASVLLASLVEGSVGVIYADPPYTKDQYQRFYHVLESLYRYDFPTSSGRGRTPTYDCVSDFCLASRVESAFRSLFEAAWRVRSPLVLSYPRSGLLHRSGLALQDVAAPWMTAVGTHQVGHEHSTLGASNGRRKMETEEIVYVFKPGD